MATELFDLQLVQSVLLISLLDLHIQLVELCLKRFDLSFLLGNLGFESLLLVDLFCFRCLKLSLQPFQIGFGVSLLALRL